MSAAENALESVIDFIIFLAMYRKWVNLNIRMYQAINYSRSI